MNSFKHYLISKRNFAFLLLIFLAILPRFIFLDKVPTAINQDEIHYVFDAKSFFLTGRDVLGQVTPLDVLLFHPPQGGPLQAELPYFLEMTTVGPMSFSIANEVLPNAILGILIVLLIYLITTKLFNRNTGFLAAFIAAINPWFIFLSRTTYEAGPAALFFLCVFYILLITKGWRILLTVPFALLAFYSYIGTKLIFLPFMFLSILYVYLYVNKRKYLKQYFLVFLFSVILTLFFLLQIGKYQFSRTSEIVLPNNPAITEQVNKAREITIQNPFIDLFDNKISIYSIVLIKNTFNVFSPSYLFVNGDYFFMTGGHGLFYYMDVIFLIIGTVWLFLYKKKLFILFASMIFLASLIQVLHDPSGNGGFSHHMALVVPFMIPLIGVGIDQISRVFNKKKYSYLFIFFVVLIYLIALASFAYFYFLKYPLQEGTFEIENRILSKYITLSKNEERQIVIYSVDPELAFREFLFYSNSYNKNTINTINDSLRKDRFVFNNISFVPCNKNQLSASQSALIFHDVNCKKNIEGKSISISQLGDSGGRYSIYNDRICSKYRLPAYISNLKFSDFNIENLTEKKFCETFIVSYH